MSCQQRLLRANLLLESKFASVGHCVGRNPKPILFVIVAIVAFFGISFVSYAKPSQETDVFAPWVERGSRLFAEREYLSKHYSAVVARAEAIITMPKNGKTTVSAATLNDHLMASERIRDMRIDYTLHNGDYKSVSFSDVCARFPTPPVIYPLVYDQLFGTKGVGLPCTRTSPLDCFQEGGYDYDLIPPLLGLPLDGLQTNPYLTKPSFRNMTDEQIYDIVSKGCDLWAGIPVPENLMFGGVRRENPPAVSSIESMASTLTVITPEQLAEKYCAQPCIEQCGTCGTNCLVGAYDCVGLCASADPDPSVNGNCSQLVYTDILSGCLLGEPCGVLSDLFSDNCTACQVNARERYREMGFTNCANCVEGCSNATTQCSLECLLNAPCYQKCFNDCKAVPSDDADYKLLLEDTKNIILKWELASIDDLIEARKDVEDTTVNVLFQRSTDDLVNQAGTTNSALVVLSYLFMLAYASFCMLSCNSLESRVFLGATGVLAVIGSVICAFSLYSMFGIKFDATTLQVLPFLALGLGVNNMFVLASVFEFWTGATVPEMTAAMLRVAGPSVSLSAVCSFIAFCIAAAIPLPAVSNFSVAMILVIVFNYFMLIFGFTAIAACNASRMVKGRRDCFCCFYSTDSPGRTTEWGPVPACFSKFALGKKAKVFWLLVSVVITSIAIYGATQLEVGLPLSDIVPSDSYASPFLAEREKNYGDFSAGLVIGLDSSGNTVQLDYSQPSVIRRVLDLERALAQAPGMQTSSIYVISEGSWVDGFVKYLNNQTCAPDCLDLNEPYQFIIDGRTYDYFLPKAETFFPYLREYNELAGFSTVNQMELDLNTTIIYSTRIDFYQTGMNKMDTILSHLRETRKICDASGLPAFTSGLVTDLYSQFLRVQEFLVRSILICLAVMFVLSYIFLFHPGAALLMVFIIGLTLFQTYGFLTYFGVQMNGVCVVNLLMAASCSVEFTVHYLRRFLILDGTRQDRATKALEQMFVPLVNGAVSTFLGVVPVAFATFPYFRIYFFNQYLCILVFGLYNGLVILPTLLSYCGPSTISTLNRAGEGVAPTADATGSKRYSTFDDEPSIDSIISTYEGRPSGGPESMRLSPSNPAPQANFSTF